MLLLTESSRSAAYYACYAVNEGLPEAAEAVSIAKSYASDAYREVGNRAPSRCTAAWASPGRMTAIYTIAAPKPPSWHSATPSITASASPKSSSIAGPRRPPIESHRSTQCSSPLCLWSLRVLGWELQGCDLPERRLGPALPRIPSGKGIVTGIGALSAPSSLRFSSTDRCRTARISGHKPTYRSLSGHGKSALSEWPTIQAEPWSDTGEWGSCYIPWDTLLFRASSSNLPSTAAVTGPATSSAAADPSLRASRYRRATSRWT